ncbi:MAG TPA: hypothetical protein VKC33_00210 [Burkholderiales bacterium]|nr:hypothetical protein [Burkholderiales bacterium]
MNRAIVLACALLLPAGARTAVTYSFDWYCSGCAKIGMGSNGREGPFGSDSVCQSARASLSGSLAARGCGSRCFNPQPCISAGEPDVPPSPPGVSAPAKIPPATAQTAPVYDPSPERVRRADDVKHRREKAAPHGPDVSGRWRNSFSWYEARSSKDAVEIVLVETCRTPDCIRREYPNRPVFRGRLEGSRLVGVVPIRSALESEQSGRHCATPTGEFHIEGSLSDDGRAIVWRHAQLPVGEGCAPVTISLGTWRRG